MIVIKVKKKSEHLHISKQDIHCTSKAVWKKKCIYIFQFNPLVSGSCNIKYIMVSINLKINYWVYAHTFTYYQIHQYILQQTCN